jgi:hypothetical protein
MATIYTSVDVDVDIEFDEFVESCSNREIQLLISYLAEMGHLGRNKLKDDTKMTSNEIEFSDKMLLLSDKYYQMTTEEIEFLETIYNKYR